MSSLLPTDAPDLAAALAPAPAARRSLTDRLRPYRRPLERLLLGAGLALLVWLLSRFPLVEILRASRAIGPALALTPFLCLGWFAAGSTSLYVLLERRVPWRALMWNRFVGEAYNALLPAGGVGGEPVKLRQLQRYVTLDRALVVLLTDRLLENLVAFCFSGVIVLVGISVYAMSPAMRTGMLTYGIVANAIAFGIALFLLSPLPTMLGGRVARLLGTKQLGAERLRLGIVGHAFVWNLVARAIGLGEIMLLFYLLGLPVTLGSVLFTAGAISAAGFIGGAIPQGLGVTDAAAVAVFAILHLPGPAAIAFALARRGRMMVCSALGVVAHLGFRRSVAAAEDRFVARRLAEAVPVVAVTEEPS